MWIDQHGILKPKNTSHNYVGFEELGPVSTFQQSNLSDHVNIAPCYQPSQKRILQSKCILSDHVSIGSGWQPLPIPSFSGSWVEPQTIFPKEQPAIIYPVLENNIVEYTHFGNDHPTKYSIPYVGSITSRNQALSQNNSRKGSEWRLVEKQKVNEKSVQQNHEVYLPIAPSFVPPSVVSSVEVTQLPDSHWRLVEEKSGYKKPVPQNLEVYLQDRCQSIAPSFAPPSVVSSVEVAQLPAYTREAKAYLPPISSTKHHQKGVWNGSPFNNPSKRMSKLGLFPGRRRTETNTKGIPTKIYPPILGRGNSVNIHSYSNMQKKHKTPPEVSEKDKVKVSKTRTKKEGKAASKGKGRPKALGLVRYSVPTRPGKKKTLTIKVDPSKPSMNKIEIEHGHAGDIYIGNFEGACSYELCQRNNIAVIMNMSTKTIRKHPNIRYYAFPIGDLPSEDILSLFKMTSNIIEGHLQAGQNILVNCNMGVSRSTTIVLAYIMKKTKMELAPALALCRSFRVCCNPNPGFIKQLERHQQRIQGTKAGKKVSQEVGSEQKKPTAWQKFTISCPSCYARVNNEDPQASSKEVVVRRSFSVV